MNAAFDPGAVFDQLAGPAGLKLSLALVHFLWQGILIAALAAMLMRFVGGRSPARRYAIAVAGLLLMAAAPVVTFCLVTPPEPLPQAIVIESLPEGDLLLEVERLDALLATMETDPAFAAVGEPAMIAGQLSWQEQLQRWQPLALALWLFGTGLFAVRLGVGVQAAWWFGRDRRPLPDEWLETATRVAARLGIKTPRIFVSERVVEAVAVGLFKPMVLLPAAWIGQVPLAVLEAVLAHEMAHLRRYDLWVNLLQRIVEAAIFYHPAVWWLSRRVRLEREYCCDETAATAITGRAAYARALEFVATERVARRRPVLFNTALAAGLGGDEMELLNRVCRVLGVEARPRRGNWLSEGLLALAVPAALWAAVATIGPEIAQADETNEDQQQAEGAVDDRDDFETSIEPEADRGADNWRELDEIQEDLVAYHDPDLQAALRELREEMQSLREEVTELRRARDDRIEQELNQPVALRLDDVPLRDVILKLAKTTGVNFLIDEVAFSEAGLRSDRRISIDVRDDSARDALKQILTPLSLGYIVEDGVVKITNPKRTTGPLIVRTYPVADLLAPARRGSPAIEYDTLLDLITGSAEPESWEDAGGRGTIRVNEATQNLVVRQTRRVHDEIVDLLESFRHSRQRGKTRSEASTSSKGPQGDYVGQIVDFVSGPDGERRIKVVKPMLPEELKREYEASIEARDAALERWRQAVRSDDSLRNRQREEVAREKYFRARLHAERLLQEAAKRQGERQGMDMPNLPRDLSAAPPDHEHRVIHGDRIVTFRKGPEGDLQEVEVRQSGLPKSEEDVKEIVQILQSLFGRHRPVWAKSSQWKQLDDDRVELEIKLWNGSTPTFLLTEHDGRLRLKPLRRFFLSDGSEPFFRGEPLRATRLPGDAEQQIQSALNRQISLHLDEVPLREALQELAEDAGVNIAIDANGLAEEGVTPDVPISYELDDVSLRSALKVVLTPLSLGYVIDDEILTITSLVRTKGPFEVQTYPVGELIKSDSDSATPGLTLETLIDVITGTIEPNSWEQVGGQGVVRPTDSKELGTSLVVRQSREVHDEIADLIDELRQQHREKTNPINRRHKTVTGVAPPNKPLPPAPPVPLLRGEPGKGHRISRVVTLEIDGKQVQVVVEEHRDPDSAGPAKEIELHILKSAEKGAKIYSDPAAAEAAEREEEAAEPDHRQHSRVRIISPEEDSKFKQWQDRYRHLGEHNPARIKQFRGAIDRAQQALPGRHSAFQDAEQLLEEAVKNPPRGDSRQSEGGSTEVEWHEQTPANEAADGASDRIRELESRVRELELLRKRAERERDRAMRYRKEYETRAQSAGDETSRSEKPTRDKLHGLGFELSSNELENARVALEFAKANYEQALETNRRVADAIPEFELRRLQHAVEQASLAAENAELKLKRLFLDKPAQESKPSGDETSRSVERAMKRGEQFLKAAEKARETREEAAGNRPVPAQKEPAHEEPAEANRNPTGRTTRFETNDGAQQVQIIAPPGVTVGWNTWEIEKDEPLEVRRGEKFRLRLSNIPGQSDVTLRPWLEISVPALEPKALLTHNALPIKITSEDLDQVASGNSVTKVIYLPSSKFQDLAVPGVQTLVSTRLDPGIDPVAEARKRGTVLAVLRLGREADDVKKPQSVGPTTVPLDFAFPFDVGDKTFDFFVGFTR